MFLTDVQLNAAVASTLQKASVPLTGFWDEIITAANLSAYWEIVGQLSARGFTKAQIDAWDRGPEFQRALGVFWALNHQAAQAATDEYSRVNLKEFDRRMELSGNPSKGITAVVVTASGVFQRPETTVGQATTGPLDTTTDHFVPFDPCDPRMGTPTRL